MSLAQKQSPRLKLRKSGLKCKLWPNGQLVFYHPKREKPEPKAPREIEREDTLLSCVKRAYPGCELADALDSLGLSNVPNSDKKPKAMRSGLSGISSLGKNRVRNAAYMMQRSHGKYRLTFATVTIPALSREELCKVHVHWNKIIERYRLEVRRVLIGAGLSGEIVGVSEVQEERYEKTGYPYLHAHFLFVGFAKSGGWALTPAKHDFIWRKCIRAATGAVYGPEPSYSAACNLQSVKTDAAGYLSKYMSKGSEITEKIVADGFDWWLPRQWWSCSISLVRRMEKEMRTFTEGALWLLDRAEERCRSLFTYYREVSISMKNGDIVVMAGVGMLSPPANGKVRKFLSL